MAVEGTEQLLKDFDELLKKNMKAVQGVTAAGAATVQAEMISRISDGRKTGKKYPNLPNRSSAAGEYPAKQSGKLIRAIKTVLSPDKTQAFVGVHNTAQVPYAVWLEYGTRNMAERPFVFTSMQKHKKKIRDMYIKALKL